MNVRVLFYTTIPTYTWGAISVGSIINVLIVDDNATFLRYVARSLGQHDDIEVAGVASTVDDALTVAAAQRPSVILLDLLIGGEMHTEAIPTFKRRFHDSALVVLTMHDAPYYREYTKDKGADGFVSKIRITEELLPEIRRVARRRS